MTIDLCYESTIKQLTEQNKILQISKELLELQTNEQRVLLVYNTLKSLNAFPELTQVNKCKDLSIKYRNQGNQHFQSLENYKAWQYYNLSLLYAPVGSEEYSLAISNRSAVLFSLKKYNECLKDIERVFTLQYPDNVKEKLLKRQKLAQGKLIDKPKDCSAREIDKFLTWEAERENNYACASSKIKVLFNKEMGRHVVANEDIAVGEIIAKEDPYLLLLLKTQLLFSCSYCLSRSANLYPCENCCFSLFCNKTCQSKAWVSYHSVECSMMATILELDFTKLEWIALRTTIKARSDYESWNDLFEAVKEAESRVNTEHHGMVHIDGKWIYDSKYYSSIHTLATNVEKRSMSDIFQKSVTAAVFLYMLQKLTKFLESKDDIEYQSIENIVCRLLLLHSFTAPTNMHNISSNIQGADGNFVEVLSLGSAPYAFLSLLNHSCAPNVVRFSKLGSGEMFLFALRPIKKGMQLFDNYGPHHALESRGERTLNIFKQYKFKCVCEACINDWPMYFSLKPAANLPAKYANEIRRLLGPSTVEKLQKGDKKVALKIYGPLCKYAEILEAYAPCMELADCQEALKQCLVIFEGLVPYGYRDTIEWKAKDTNILE